MKETSRADDWRSLCEQASKEANPEKLLDLIARINRALEESEAPVNIDLVAKRPRFSNRPEFLQLFSAVPTRPRVRMLSGRGSTR
jgi:hypothetical protein